jgi:hypothetical protein
MADAFDVKFEVTGPIFDGSGLRVMPGIINRGLMDIAILEGSNKVKDQLYGPPASQYWKTDPSQRHGAKTRTLKRAIGVRVEQDNAVIVDAHSNSKSGAVLNYARKIEDLYHMFANTSAAIKRNKAALQDKYIGDALVEAFQ